MSIGALRMIHNIMAKSVENTVNGAIGYMNAPYEMNSFSENLVSCQDEIDQCLMEICQMNPEIIEHFKSPYSRLGIVWLTAGLQSIRKKSPVNINRNAPRLQPQQPERVYTV